MKSTGTWFSNELLWHVKDEGVPGPRAINGILIEFEIR